MEGNKICGNTFLFEAIKYFRCKVKSGRGGCYRPLMFGIYGLIAFVVALNCISIQIGGQRYYTSIFYDFGETKVSSPVEIHNPGIANGSYSGCREGYLFSINIKLPYQWTLFPFFIVSDKACPGALLTLLKRLCKRHSVRFKAEYLDGRTRLFLEEKTGMNDFRIVENQ